MRLFALMVAIIFSSASLAQVCRIGCPCGDTCISCADTCRVGAGDARSDSPSTTGFDQTAFLAVMGSLAALACLSFAVAVPLMMMGPSGTAELFAPPKTPTAPYDNRKSTEHVHMLLSAKCSGVEVSRVDDTVIGTGCGGRWVCSESNEMWVCDEDIAPTTSPRVTNEDFN